MKKQDILDIAKCVREAILDRTWDTSGKCILASMLIATLIEERGEKATLIEGKPLVKDCGIVHWWVIWRGFRIDVTADQYNPFIDEGDVEFDEIVFAPVNDFKRTVVFHRYESTKDAEGDCMYVEARNFNYCLAQSKKRLLALTPNKRNHVKV